MSGWMPGAPRDTVAGGRMEGQSWRSIVWHTSESGNGPDAIRGVAAWVKRQHSEYHLLWNPWTGQFLQLIDATTSARALRNASSGYRTNRKGTVLLQVCVIGRTADQPLAGGSPLHGWPKLRAWTDDLGIPPTDRTGTRSRSRWESSGVHRHADAPGNDHTDPGPIDFGLLYGEPPPPEPEPFEMGDTMILVADKGTGRVYAVQLSGPAYLHAGSDIAELKKALADPSHVAELDAATFARFAAYAPPGAIPQG